MLLMTEELEGSNKAEVPTRIAEERINYFAKLQKVPIKFSYVHEPHRMDCVNRYINTIPAS